MRTFKKGQIVRVCDRDFQVVSIDRSSKYHTIIFDRDSDHRLYIKDLLKDEKGNEYAEYNQKLSLFFKA